MLKRKLMTVSCLASLILPATALGSAPGAAAATPLTGKALEQYQAQYLDPQVDESAVAPQPAPHSGTHSARDLATIEAAAAAPTDPSQVGSWSYDQPFPSDFNAIHVICSPTGKCLLAAGSGRNARNFAAKTFRSYVYNTVTKTKKLIYTPDDLFCSGHVLLPDGRALIVGGTAAYNPFKGSATQYVFDFNSETYQRVSDMSVGRWYPSVVTMSDGKQLITSGFDQTGMKTSLVETFDPTTNTSTLLPAKKSLPNYPRTFQTSTPGQIFFAGPGGAGFWYPYTGAFRGVPKPAVSGPNAFASCFVGDVRDQNLMIMGGGWPAVSATSVINLTSATPAYKPGPPLGAAKGYLSCVNLPDGTVFEANGGTSNKVSGASSETALLASLAGPWQPMSPLPAGENRLYHSLLFLLDDGTVVSMTSNPDGGVAPSTSMLVYSPPYLSRGVRPVITSNPTEVGYGGTYAIGTAVAVGSTVPRITVTTGPAATHDTDLNQRYLSLPLVNGSITLPSQSSIMPPGWYRIWAVDDSGRPSIAKWIHLH